LKIFSLYCGATLPLCLAALVWFYLLTPEHLQIYGEIQLNKPLPKKFEFASVEAVHGQSPEFTVYFFPAYVDLPCLCSEARTTIEAMGGRFEELDSKIAKVFGLPLLHDGVSYKLADSLLITLDQYGIVKSIHRNVSEGDIPRIVRGVFGESEYWSGVLKYRLTQMVHQLRLRGVLGVG
jgi:hypothetical protein